MKLLVTGAAGQVGHEVVALGTGAGHDMVAAERSELSITDLDAVRAFVRRVAPDAVINCAAFTDVDRCERDEELAFAVNATGVGHLRAACEEVGARLTTISTDYVFSGTQTDPYTETDEPTPISAYGRSKFVGELLAGPDALIVRTSWLFGAIGTNIVKTVMRLLEGDAPLTFVDDQRGCPTGAADLAATLVALTADDCSGVFHATNGGPVSWYEFAREIAELAGVDPDRIGSCATSDIDPPRLAPRPANSVLANDALARAGYPPMRHHGDALADVMAVLEA